MKAEKKHLYIAAALLFCLLTGIIIGVQTADDEAITVSKESNASRILIIDAGHGGADGGAVAADGTAESSINLSIALKLNSLAKIFGIQTMMTRENEELPYPQNAATIAEKKRWDQHTRLEMINSAENAVLISIHQNKYPDSRPFGPQVLYGKISGSDALGTLCHELLNSSLCPENRRLAAPASDNIYLMKNALCPAILVECGFISNPSELQKLLDDCYQRKLVCILLASYLCYIS